MRLRPRTPLGELTALPDPLAVFEGGEGRGGKGERRGGKGEGGKGD